MRETPKRASPFGLHQRPWIRGHALRGPTTLPHPLTYSITFLRRQDCFVRKRCSLSLNSTPFSFPYYRHPRGPTWLLLAAVLHAQGFGGAIRVTITDSAGALASAADRYRDRRGKHQRELAGEQQRRPSQIT
jgi:hypothetical protein